VNYIAVALLERQIIYILNIIFLPSVCDVNSVAVRVGEITVRPHGSEQPLVEIIYVDNGSNTRFTQTTTQTPVYI
jgi:hypothetical protein